MSSKLKNAATKEDNKSALVPKLRFPDFRDADGWETATLGELSEILRGGSPRPIESFLTRDADGLNWLKIGDVDKEAKYVARTQERVHKGALNKTRVVKPGDLILSNSMSFGRPYILEIETCIHDGWIAITDINMQIEHDYLYYLISAPSSQIYFEANAAGSGVQNLNADIIKSLPIYSPKSPEQQKIAECLSSVDKLIAAQASKVDALKIHKKGLLQQLFPREGETQPRRRFPEFQDAAEWDRRQLGDICVLVRGPFGGSLKKEIFVDSGYAVYEQSHAINADFTSFRYYIPKTKYQELKRFSVNPGEIIMSCSGTMGKFAIVPGGINSGVINQALLKLTVKRSCIPMFLKEILELPVNQEQLLSQSAGGAIKNVVSVSEIKEVKLFIPRLAEQQKITDFFSSLDDIIAAQARKLEAFKSYKKGLMQQLFPSPGEVKA